MPDNRMNDIMKSSLDGMKSVADIECAIGRPINTPSGVTVIPVSKVSFGFATGGVDLYQKKFTSGQTFGGGGGSGVSITPLAFLTVGVSGEINLLPLEKSSDDIGKVVSLIEKAPELLEKIRDAMS